MKIDKNIALLILLMVFGIVFRLIPHPSNFSPLIAIGLFSSTLVSNRYFKFIIPLATVFLSDLILNNTVYSQYNNGFTFFYLGSAWVYASYLLVTIIGSSLSKLPINVGNTALRSILGTAIFFLVSNFGVWISSGLYPKTDLGLVACFTAAIPFLQNSLCGDLMFTAILFGAWELSLKKVFVTKFGEV